MKIATIGRGKIGGGLADLWEAAGHEVTRFGHEGGDVGDAEVVLVAVPGDSVEEAREAVETLHRDAGFDPICAGPLTNAGKQEAMLDIVFGIVKEGGMGPFFYRFAPPAQF